MMDSTISNTGNGNRQRHLRSGFTTGSCAAAASKAALMMLMSGEDIFNVSIMTPKGIVYNAEIVDISRNEVEQSISCAVIKDGGDDPDITTGTKIFSTVKFSGETGITIEGGKGVGVVTRPGLDQPVGEAAINSVPRKMITENLLETLEAYGKKSAGIKVTISVPEGEKLAEKTFNPKLGITGGISILGTTGIVEPMSDKAILDTINAEISIRKAEGSKILLAAPGNYGLAFLEEAYGLSKDAAIMSSNFIYDTVMMATEEGFEKLLFAGHIGKLIKVAGGVKNTHSRYGDHRMEILCDIVREVSFGTPDIELDKLLGEINSCVTTDEAVRIITREGFGDKVFRSMADRIKLTMEEWAKGRLKAEVIVFASENREIAATNEAHYLIQTLSK